MIRSSNFHLDSFPLPPSRPSLLSSPLVVTQITRKFELEWKKRLIIEGENLFNSRSKEGRRGGGGERKRKGEREEGRNDRIISFLFSAGEAFNTGW